MASSPSPPPSTSAAVWAVANWREVNIHDDNETDRNNEGNNDHNNDDAGAGDGGNASCQLSEVTKEDGNDTYDSLDDENPDCALVFQMFGTEENDADIYEDVLYEYSTDMHDCRNIHDITAEKEKEETVKTTRRKTVMIRHHRAYPNSTGLAVWKGSEILARYVCDGKNNNNWLGQIQTQKVLEIGAGAGLPGIVCHTVLHAAQVIVSDGDIAALNNLKYNVDSNRNQKTGRIECVQLIWGKQPATEFVQHYGQHDLVFASDCVYMTPSLLPMWETIDTILTETGTFIYAQTAASTVPWKEFKQQIRDHNFEVVRSLPNIDQYEEHNYTDGAFNTAVSPPSSLLENINTDIEEDEFAVGIHIFRRKQQQ